MPSPTFPVRLDGSEQEVLAPNPPIVRPPLLPGFAVVFNNQLASQLSAPFPYIIELSNIAQSGATTDQVPVWNGSQWVPSTRVGPRGSVWLFGNGAPDNSLGVDGDVYLDDDTDDLYNKVDGVWVYQTNIRGATGNGIDRIQRTSGTGAPGTTDIYTIYYTDGGTTTFSVYNGANGAPGAPGSVWYYGSGVPSGGLGINGDYYLQTITSNVYYKSGGTWAIVANIRGATGNGIERIEKTGGTGAPGTTDTYTIYYTDGGTTTFTVYNGANGTNGAPGSVWYNGSGAPSGGLGINGDYYLNNVNGDVYQKSGGSWSVVANIKGANGTNGATWYNGTGTPSAGLGVNNDYYLNTTNGDVYQKVIGSWSLIGNIKGPAGTNGATWYTGSGAPSAGLGVNGDLYLSTTTSDVYQKSGGSWSVICNIKGATGAAGAPGSVWYNGSGAPSGATGIDGDYYLNTANSDVYYKSGGSWSVVANIKGGNGANGSVWYNGTGAPSAGLGVNGDYYLNNANGDVYTKSGGSWSVIGNIKGPAGNNGTNGATWYTGSGAPSAGLGVNGDLYLNTVNSDVYQKSGGSWSVIANIKGATGAGVPTGGAANQPLIKNSATDYDTKWGLAMPQSGSAGPLLFDGAAYQIGTRSTTWASRGSGLFTGQLVMITDIGVNGTLFFWNGSRWLPTAPITLLQTAQASSVGATTSKVNVTSAFIPQNLLQATSVFRVVFLWSMTNNSNSKLLELAINTSNAVGGTVWFTTTLTTVGFSNEFRELRLANSLTTNALTSYSATGGFGTQGGNPARNNINFNQDVYLNVNMQKITSSSDSLALESVQIQLFV